MKLINDRQIEDVAKMAASKKMSEYADKTAGEFFQEVIRPLIEFAGFEPLQQSKEAELENENLKLKAELEELKSKTQ